MKEKNNLSPYYNDYEKSFSIYKSLLTTNYKIEAYPPLCANNEIFGKEFPGSLIKKPKYDDCIFVESSFNSSDGSLAKFHRCVFDSCLLNNCDLRYCDIYKSRFLSKTNESKISSCNFSFGNFIESSFADTSFSGSSFRQMQFESVCFDDCTMLHCSIEQSTIKNCRFKNLDLRRVGVRYCTFENTIFDNVIFHILDLARNYGLIQQLKESQKPVFVAYKNEEIMSLEQAVSYLYDLLPYYYETGQFYELINVLTAHSDYDEIINILPLAFESVIVNHDFAALQDLCSLIVKLKICTTKQLRDFYSLINKLIIPDDFPHYLRKSYNTYIENIKYILVDNPHENPEASILLKTDIVSLEGDDMAKLLMSIESNINELAPNVDTIVKLTHHSPYDVMVTVIGALPEILLICQVFYYGLGGAKSFSDLKKSRKEKVEKKYPQTRKDNEKSNKEIEISVGNIFNFKYKKEYTKHVNSLEFNIK